MANNSTATNGYTKEQMVEIVANKDAKDLTAEDRVYYGIPRWRGATAVDSKGNEVIGCGYICVIDNEKRFTRIEQNPFEYKEFLQDFFYRKFMGYENHYFREPKDSRTLRIYNETAVECGHPEYTITLKIEDKKSEQHTESSESNNSVESVKADKFDVLDTDGSVIAENCDANATPNNPEKEEKKEQPKQEKKEEPKKEDPTPAKKNDAKDKKESNAESSVIFNETSRDGKKFNVDKNRHNEFKELNAPIIKQYPGVKKLVDACKKQNKLVCLRLKDPDTDKSYNGLIYATIFDRGVPGSAHSVFIDPAKIRSHYSFIRPAEAPNQVFPFECPMVSFNKYLDEYIATNGQLSTESANAIDNECGADYKFLYHIMYSSIPAADLEYVSAVLAPLFFEIDRSNLSIRFKAIDYTSKYSFTLYCAEDVGLGKYAKDNARFSGLKISVRVASEKDVKFRAIGKHAQEFRDILFNNSLGAFDIKLSTNDAKSPEQKDNEKQNPEQGKQKPKKEQKPKQQNQDKKEEPKTEEPTVNPAEVAKAVEEQKPEIQTTDKSPEEKAAEAERAANFAEAMKNQKQEQIVEASSGIH